MSLSEIERTLPTLTGQDLSGVIPGINSTPGVCGGSACIRSTRIAVWMLEQARRSGVREESMLRNWPGLTADDLANAWAYVRSHRGEIDSEIAEHEKA